MTQRPTIPSHDPPRPKPPRRISWRSIDERYRTWSGYFLALVSVAIAIDVRYLLIDNTNEDTMFLAAVAITAMFGGLGPGLLAVALAILITVCDYPILYHDSEHPYWTMGFFVMESILISLVCGMLRQSRRRASAHAQEAAVLRDRIISISEAEQRRIGQDLHDNLGQQLTGIAFLSQSLAQRLGRRGEPEAEEAHRIAAIVRQTIGATRDLARGLTPVAMEADDLPSALKQLAESTSSLFKIVCRVDAPEDVRAVSQEAAIHLYRIAQEAISNAVKHGHATSIDIELRDGDPLELRIRDNGVGIDPAANPAGGLGINIMRHRARLIAGALDVRKDPAGGTIVCCQIPSVNGNQ